MREGAWTDWVGWIKSNRSDKLNKEKQKLGREAPTQVVKHVKCEITDL